jgi:MOSC domain-containing protein YiiM
MTMILASLNVPAAGAGGAPVRLVPATAAVEIVPAGFATPAADGPRDDGAFPQALFAYPTLHHAFWRTVRAQARAAAADAPLPAAAFDEHLALDGVQESQLWIGDLLRFADCTLAVSAPRLPDLRFNATLGFEHAAKMVAQSRWCGFWLAVRRPGRLAAGEAFELVPGPRATGLVELFRARTSGVDY